MGEAFGAPPPSASATTALGLAVFAVRVCGLASDLSEVWLGQASEHEYDRRCQRSAQCLNQQWFHFQTTFIDGFLVWNILSAEWRETRHGIRSVVFLSARLQYSGLNLNQDKARQRRTGLKLIHYKVAENLLPAWS